MLFKFSKSKEEHFWAWFAKNADRYLHLEEDTDRLFDALEAELGKVDPHLTFEFSDILEDGSRELYISADGIVGSFPAVINLVKQAPQLKSWKIIAFRQPYKNISQVEYEGLTVKLDDIFFRYTKDNPKINLGLYMRGFYESSAWSGISFIVIDTLLGEFDTETYIGAIDKKPLLEKEVPNLIPIKDLPDIVLQFKSPGNK
jgi:hypothetical protein